MRAPYGALASVAGAGLVAALGKITKKETAEAIGGILGSQLFNLQQLCSQPAPVFPTLTTEDWFNVLSPVHTGDYALSIQNFEQWVTAYMWPTWCQCNDGQPAGATTPTSIPDIDSNPGVPTATGGAHCWDVTTPFTAPNTQGPGGAVLILTSSIVPATSTVAVTSFTSTGPTTAQTLPSGLTNVQYAFSSPTAGNATESDFTLEWFSASGASLGGHPTRDMDGTSAPLTAVTIPSGAASWAFWASNPGANNVSCTFELVFDCAGGGTNVLTQPCCPPDPILEYKLNQILNVVLNLTGGSAPNEPISWHDGPVHSGLRGSGSFLITAGALGIRFNVTTPPEGVTVDPGNPDFYWNMGFWSPYALGSPLRGGRLVFLNQSVQLPEFSDQIGYTLKNGTVMNATELLPTTP